MPPTQAKFRLSIWSILDVCFFTDKTWWRIFGEQTLLKYAFSKLIRSFSGLVSLGHRIWNIWRIKMSTTGSTLFRGMHPSFLDYWKDVLRHDPWQLMKCLITAPRNLVLFSAESERDSAVHLENTIGLHYSQSSLMVPVKLRQFCWGNTPSCLLYHPWVALSCAMSALENNLYVRTRARKSFLNTLSAMSWNTWCVITSPCSKTLLSGWGEARITAWDIFCLYEGRPPTFI